MRRLIPEGSNHETSNCRACACRLHSRGIIARRQLSDLLRGSANPFDQGPLGGGHCRIAQMRSEMHRPQAGFKCPDGSSIDRDTIQCYLTFGEKAVEQQFTPDEFHAERSGSGAHPLEVDHEGEPPEGAWPRMEPAFWAARRFAVSLAEREP